jgi:hypothetical protein
VPTVCECDLFKLQDLVEISPLNQLHVFFAIS